MTEKYQSQDCSDTIKLWDQSQDNLVRAGGIFVLLVVMPHFSGERHLLRIDGFRFKSVREFRSVISVERLQILFVV